MMFGIQALSCVLLGILLIPQFTEGKVDPHAVDVLQNALDNSKKIIDSFTTSELMDFTKRASFLEKLNQISGVIGIAGGIFSFAMMFVPKEDSEMVALLKKQFLQLNHKLDTISADLDDIKNIITLESQRVEYIGAANKILFGYNQLMNNYLTDLTEMTSCSTFDECLKERLAISESYVKHFDVKTSLFQVLNGIAQPTSDFGDPILDLIKKTYKCDIKKVLEFANGVIKLSIKGQQLVLVHEQLSGTNSSMVSAMNDWSKAAYNIRKKVDEITEDCYKNLEEYIKEDVGKIIDQPDPIESNQDISIALKTLLDARYPWISWIVVAYYSKEPKHEQGFSTFKYNLPSKDGKPARVIRIFAQDTGTYTNQWDKLDSAHIRINRLFDINELESANYVFNTLKEELQKKTVWSSLSAYIVLNENFMDPKKARNPEDILQYYDENLSLSFQTHQGVAKRHIQVLAAFKSLQQIDGATCDKTCNNKGSCKSKPYTSKTYCFCNVFYYGGNCENYDKAGLAANIDGMIAITGRIPKLTDIYYEISNMQCYMSTAFGRVDDAIAVLDKNLKARFNILTARLTDEFQRSNLLTQYSDTFTELTYYLDRFQTLQSSSASFSEDTSLVALSKDVMKSHNIKKWIYELNTFIVGRNDIIFLAHKPFTFLLMERHGKSACSTRYKQLLDDAWRQIMILQNQVFIMWAQAAAILNEPADNIMLLYEKTIEHQNAFMENATCDLSVANSKNLECSGGFYFYRDMIVPSTCRANYYLVGNSTVSCDDIPSCLPCSCNPKGSSSSQCNDQTGQCPCINKYYGKTCHDRDCEWTSFGPYGSCSKSCDYGVKTRTRSHAFTQEGKGNACTGSSQSTLSCLLGCCSNQFHCSAEQNCVPISKRCDYNYDCINNQDEQGCSETCEDRYSYYSSYGGGNAVYLDRQSVYCNNLEVLQMFKLTKINDDIRYHYKCCKLTADVCDMVSYTNSYTDDGGGKTEYLDRQGIAYAYSFIQGFTLNRNSDHDQWSYSVKFCKMRSSGSRLECYVDETAYITDGSTYYLTLLTVACKNPYFLQTVRINRSSGHDKIQYKFKCCKIIRQ